MQKIFLNILLVFFVMTPLCGQQSVAHAESFNGYASECIKQPEKCQTTDKNEKNSKSTDVVSEEKGSIITVWDVAKMLFALLFVIGLLYFLLKFINKKSRSYQQNRFIQNIGGTALGGNRSLQIVKTGKRILILGVGEDIRLLKEIDDDKEVEDFVNSYNDQLEQTLEPRDIITKALNAMKNKNISKSTIQESKSTSFQNILKEQLSTIKKDRKDVLSQLDQKEKKTDE